LGSMARSITAATLILAAACSRGAAGPRIEIGGGGTLSYAQYQSLEQGMEAQAVLKAFGRPADILEQDGVVRGLTYRCEDAVGQARQLRMVFTEQGTLDRWALGTERSAAGE